MGVYTTHYWENQHVSGLPRGDRRSGEFRTYTPSPLADIRLAISTQTDRALAEAERAVRELNRSTHKDLGLVARFLLRSEAIASSYIEGIAPSPRNVALAELGQYEDVRGLSDAAQDVARNMTIVREAADALAEQEWSEVADLTSLQTSLLPHETELQGVRTTQNWIGGSRYHPLDAAHVPPPPDEVPGLLEDLVGYMNGASHSAIIQAALVHAQFETIHPFPDGNGRVGRALIHTVLTRRGLTEDAILPVSLVLATRQDEYIHGLQAFRFEGDAHSGAALAAIDAWVATFGRAVQIAAQQAMLIEQRIADLRAQWEQDVAEARRREGRVRAARRDSALSAILDGLPGTPVLTVATVTRIHQVTTTAAQAALSALTEYEILETVSIGRGRRAFFSRDVLELLARSERAMASRDFDTAISPPVRAVPARPQG